MAISRLFFEISGDSSKLKTALDEAVDSAKQAGVNVTAAGRRFIDAFDNALNPTKKLTEQITLLEKAGKSQADIMKVMESQINSATKAAKDMGVPIDDLVRKYTSLESRLKQTGDSMMSFGKNMSMYVSGPIIAIGAAAIKAGDDFAQGVNTIREKTGATGDKLAQLTKDMKAVWGTVPEGLDKISVAIGGLNSILGLSGEPLQKMTTQLINLANVSHTEIGGLVKGATQLFSSWTIATDEQAGSLDYLFRVSQKSGIGIQQLLEATVQFGPPLRALGFDFETAAGAIAKWQKEGVNMESVMAGLKIGLANMAKAGAEPVQMLASVQEAIKNAKTETEAISIAMQVFGQRSAVTMAKAIKEGKFNLVEFIEAARTGTETINAAADETVDMAERMSQLQQRLEKGLVPIGEKLINILDQMMPTIVSAIDTIASWAKAFSELDPWLQKTIIGAAAVLAAIGPLAFGIGGMVKGVASLVGAMGGTSGLVGTLGKLGPAAAVAGAAFAGWEIGRWISQLFDLDNKLASVWKSLGLFSGVAKQSASDLEGASMKLYAGLVEKHSDKLKELNIDISRGSSSLDDWNTRLLKAATAVGAVKDVTQKTSAAIKETGEKFTFTGGSIGVFDDELKKLREDLDKASRPADMLATEIKKLQAAHAPMDQILAAYSEQLVKAAERQTELGQKMKPGTEALLAQAAAFKSTLSLRKEIEAAKEIQTSVDDIAVKYKREELELEKQILSIRTPAGAAEKEKMEAEKAQIDYAIKAEEIQSQFAKARLGIYEKIDKLKPGEEAYAAIIKSIAQLNDAEKKAMANLSGSKQLADNERYLEALKEQEKELKKVADIQSSIDDLHAKNQREELELQKALLEAQIPRDAAEKERIEREKAHIDYTIRSEEIRNQFLAKRLDIYEKIKDLDPAGEAYKNAMKALNDLDAAEREAMENLANRQGVEVIKRHQEEYQKMVEGVRKGAGEVFDAILSRGKGAFTELRDWIEATFMTSLKTLFQNFMTSIMTGSKVSLQGMLAGVIPGMSGGQNGQGSGGFQIPGIGSWGNVFGGGDEDSGGLADLQKVMTGGEYFQSPEAKFRIGDIISYENGKIGGLAQSAIAAVGMSLLSSGLQGEGAGSWAKSVGGGAMTGFAYGGPLGAAIGAGAGAGTKSIKEYGFWNTAGMNLLGGASGIAPFLPFSNLFGKDANKAGSQEIERDYGGVKIDKDTYATYYGNAGFSESSAYPVRADINASPQMLVAMKTAAIEQGKLGAFEDRINEWLTYTGPAGDASDAMTIGELTGDWSKLNNLWKESQYYADLVSRGLKDQADAMMMGGEAANKLLDVFVNFRKTVKDSVTDPMAEAMNVFMETGKITDILARAIVRFGGDLAQFQQTSNLVQLNQYFGEMVDHFKQTGELLPDLTRLAAQYGANMDVLANAADRMAQLQKTSNTVATLQGGLQNLAGEFDPLQQLMSGQWNTRIESALAGAGLDPTRFSTLAGAISGRGKWDSITQNALQGGIINKDLQAALGQFGGEEGKLALQMYQQGFNTLTQDLLDKTKAEMDRTYEEKIQDALSYLGTVGDETNDQITALTQTVEEQLTIAGDNLQAAINSAKEDLIEVLDNILIAVSNADEAAVAEASAVPRLASGGLIQKTGLAIVDKGERFDGGKGFGDGAQLTINGGIFLDWAGFVNYVRMAGIELRARSQA